MPLIILHKICLIGPSEAVKEVRVELTPPPPPPPPCAVEGKIPPVRDRVKYDGNFLETYLKLT